MATERVFHHDRHLDAQQIQSASHERMRQVLVRQGSLCQVRQGIKSVFCGAHTVQAGAHELLLIAPGTRMDVINRPVDGHYRADFISLPPPLIEHFRAQHPGYAQQAPSPPVRIQRLDDDSRRAWRYLLEALHAGSPQALQWHAAEAVLLAVGLQGGLAPLLRLRHDTLSERVEQCLLMRPPEARTLEQVAADCQMSVATMRRRLRAEHTGFREIRDNIQLGAALSQLQTSSRPIADIALDCGYQCASRFALRFRQRFGLLPSAVRKSPDGDGNPSADR